MADTPKLVPCKVCKEMRPPVYFKTDGPFCAKHYNEAAELDKLNEEHRRQRGLKK